MVDYEFVEFVKAFGFDAVDSGVLREYFLDFLAEVSCNYEEAALRDEVLC